MFEDARRVLLTLKHDQLLLHVFVFFEVLDGLHQPLPDVIVLLLHFAHLLLVYPLVPGTVFHDQLRLQLHGLDLIVSLPDCI